MTYKQHARKSLLLALPVMLTQVGQIMVNVADNVMVGALGGKYDNIENLELGKLALGAVSLGNALFFTVMITAFGFSYAMSPLIAQADVRGNIQRGANVLSHGLILNMINTAILLTVLIYFAPLMYKMGQPKDVVDLAIPYLEIVGYSMIPLMIFQSFRQLSEGLSLTLNIAIATIVANLLNVFLNYGFIFGNMGFPRLEVEGAAYGTLISRVVMVFILFGIMLNSKKSKTYLKAVNLFRFKKYIFRKLYQLGTPTAFQMFFEVSAFSVAAFITGMAGKNDLAAHQIALNLASITFNLCIGLGIATTIRVGNQMGLKDGKTLRKVGWTSISMISVFMLSSGIGFILFRTELAELYIQDPTVIGIAGQLLIVASLFQLSDGIQVVTLGALRGMQDVNMPTVITFISYFGLALPLGYYLTIVREMGALGMWIGLCLGLTISAILLIIRFNKKSKSLRF